LLPPPFTAAAFAGALLIKFLLFSSSVKMQQPKDCAFAPFGGFIKFILAFRFIYCQYIFHRYETFGGIVQIARTKTVRLHKTGTLHLHNPTI
jgi:hypothetical protein